MRGIPEGLTVPKRYLYLVHYTYYDQARNRQIWANRSFWLDSEITNHAQVLEIEEQIEDFLHEAGIHYEDVCSVNRDLLTTEMVVPGLVVTTE